MTGKLGQMAISGWFCAVGFGTVLSIGCGPAEEEPVEIEPETQENFEGGLDALRSEYGADKKEDFLGISDPCQLLEPFRNSEGEFFAPRIGLFVGVQASVIVGPTETFGGSDVVFDLYHRQMTVSTYRGDGVTLSGGVGANAAVHTGVAMGFTHVNDWNGYFVEGSVEIGLPFIRDLVSVEPAYFVSAIDRDGNGRATLDEALAPPEGVYGAQITVEAGPSFDPLLGASPVKPGLTQAVWQPHPDAIRRQFDDLRDRTFFLGALEMDTRLVARDGTPCPDGWPEESPETECVLEFGDPADSYSEQALHVAAALCHVTDGCMTPLSWNLAAVTVAIGALRDTGANLDKLCGGPESEASDDVSR